MNKEDLDAYFEHAKGLPKWWPFRIGDVVRYSKYFLRCTGTPPTDELWRASGVILEYVEPWVRVQWTDNHTTLIRPENLSCNRYLRAIDD